jgi:hypothetical protein
MKKIGHNYKYYWCGDYDCYFKVESIDRTAKNLPELEPVSKNSVDESYPVYNCDGLDLDDFLNEYGELNMSLLIKCSVQE